MSDTTQGKVYDLIIIGGGPAGLSAALYAGRAELTTLVLEQALPGGQAVNTDTIANYPGFPAGITGPELMALMEEQAREYGAVIEAAEVRSLHSTEGLKTVKSPEGTFHARSVIIAAGAAPRKLDIPGEAELTGSGVSYCATCDGAFFRNKAVLVVGGGDAAIQEAVFLTRFARQVTIVHHRGELRATKVVQNRAFHNPKINFRWNSILEAINGNEKVESVLVRDVLTGEQAVLPTDGVFIYVGMNPNSAFLPSDIKVNNLGYIVTDENMLTTSPGVFAAGDVRLKLLRQIVTAVSDGATAAVAVERYLTYLEDAGLV